MPEPLPTDVPVLVLDATCPMVFAGIWKSGQWLATQSVEQSALDGLFAGVQSVIEQSNLSLDDMGAFVYDEGPGSILGIRISAMAIVSWKTQPALTQVPLFTFRSLEWAVAQVRSDTESSSSFCVIGDYRKDIWLGLNSDADAIQPMDLDMLKGADSETLYHIAQRRSWLPPPQHAIPLSLDWTGHPELLL